MAAHDIPATSWESLLGPAFELAPVPMSITAEDGTYWRVNAAYCRLLGYAREELEGHSVADLAAPDLPRDYVLAMHRQFLQGEDNLPFYWRITRGDGAIRDVYLDTHRFTDDQGRRFRITHLRDVTGERETAERRHFIEYAVDNCHELIMWTDTAGQFVYANDKACHRLGYSRNQLLTMSVFDIDVGVLATGDISFADVMGHMRETGGIELESRLITADRETFPVEIKAAYVLYGGREYNCAFLRDITRRKQAEHELARQTERAQAANQAKTNFLASMSHELRTPLNAIVGFADVIERQTHGELQPRIYLDYIQDIRTAGQHLLTHINNLLDLSRSTSGHYRIFPEPLDPLKEVNTAQRLAKAQHPEGAEIVVSEPEALPRIQADPVALRRILLNVFDNALKFSPTDKPIEVSFERTGTHLDCIKLTVADQGPGMPSEEVANVLEPFVQASYAYRRDKSGAGIGLSLARELARHHDGDLKLASAPEAGTTVALTLPVDGPESASNKDTG